MGAQGNDEGGKVSDSDLKILGVEYRSGDIPVGLRIKLPSDGFEEEGVISFQDLWRAMSQAEIKTSGLPTKTTKVRAVILEPSGRPSFCAVNAQTKGNYFVRVDGQGGSSFHGSLLVHRLYPIESLPLLVGRWMFDTMKKLKSRRG